MRKQRHFIVCAVDADEAGQIRSGRLRWNRARWDASVYRALARLYSRVELLGVDGTGAGVTELFALKARGAGVVFNLALSVTPWESAFVGCIELAGLRPTGSGTLALGLANDKIRSRTLLAAAGIRTPRFTVLRRGDDIPDRLDLTPPVIVKPAYQGSSSGIAGDSVVTTRRAAIDRARRIWTRFGEPAILDEFVHGREMRVGLIEDRGVMTIAGIGDWTFPGDDQGFRTERPRKGQRMKALGAARLPPALRDEITAIGRTACDTLGLRGYASLDVRVDSLDRVTVLEVNANPGLSSDSPVWGRRRFHLTLRQIVAAALRT